MRCAISIDSWRCESAIITTNSVGARSSNMCSILHEQADKSPVISQDIGDKSPTRVCAREHNAEKVQIAC
jgi:hypothetical protein